MPKPPKTTATQIAEANGSSARLMPPKEGAVVRMYRIGHGDCFLLAFAGEKPNEPVYVLIDCGYKPGSPGRIDNPTEGDARSKRVKEITDNIRAATGGRIHLAVITHEHQDHVNAISEASFKDVKIDRTWLAWTEDPSDKMAKELRKIYQDKLLGLVAARNQLAAAGDAERLKKLDEFLASEIGGEHASDDTAAMGTMLAAAASDPSQSANKRSMKVFKDRASIEVKFLSPHEQVLPLPGTKNVRVFAMGPPKDMGKLSDLDPQGTEEFHGRALASASAANFFGAAAAAHDAGAPTGDRWDIPFAPRYRVDWANAFTAAEDQEFYNRHYGTDKSAPSHSLSHPDDDETPESKVDEVADNAEWRRIDKDWLYSADQLALAMNDETNNASLVLAFEMGVGGKVLLFVGDAQRGNWKSWAAKDWPETGPDGKKHVTSTRDLLARTVLYKVGHHCSHNATLNGTLADEYPNLGWMATGKYGGEFTAMITAVRAWAETQRGWNHPLKEIKDQLLVKASGRVFQTDTDVEKMQRPAGVTAAEWKEFMSRTTPHRLYFDYLIPA